MAIDFLGKEGDRTAKKTEYGIKMHNPEKQVFSEPKEKSKPKVIPKKEPPKTTVPAKSKQVNLVSSFRNYILKRRLTFIIIFVILIAVVSLAAYWFLTRPGPIVVANNQNVNLPIPPEPVCGNGTIEANEQCDVTGCGTDQQCVSCQCQNIVVTPPAPPAPICGNGRIESGEQCDFTGCGTDQQCVSCQCQNIVVTPPVPPAPICGNGRIESGEQCDFTGCGAGYECKSCQCAILPDTELAPLRGALVRFGSNNEVFLVEHNGELRLVDSATVSFKNNQTIDQINKNEIYIIADRFKSIRRGLIVSGKVDWDPRVLTSIELAPFQ